MAHEPAWNQKMAEQVRAKRVEHTNLTQDDPLAELADIMGMTDEQQLGVGMDEIELELERELLGETEGKPAPAEEPQDIPAEEPPAEKAEQVDADTSFDAELTDELADVLSDIDDEDTTFKEALSDELAADLEAGNIAEDEPDGAGKEKGDTLAEIFGLPEEAEEPTDIETRDEESSETDAIQEVVTKSESGAIDPYASQYRASLDDADEESDLESELEALLARTQPHQGPDEDKAAARADEDEDESAFFDAIETGETTGGDEPAAAGEAEEPVDARVDNTAEAALGELDSEFTNALDEADETQALGDVADDEEMRAESSVPEPETVALDEFDEEEFSLSGEDPGGEADYAYGEPEEGEVEQEFEDQPDAMSLEPDAGENEYAGDEVHDELNAIFGEPEITAEEPDSASNDDEIVPEAVEYEPEAETRSAGQNDLDEHFDERVAALFGHATPQPVSEAPADEEETGSVWAEQESGSGEDTNSAMEEPLAVSANDEIGEAPEEGTPADEATEAVAADDHGGDPNLDALAALERAVAELSGPNKGAQSKTAPQEDSVPDVETVPIEEAVAAIDDDFGVPDIPEPEKPSRPMVFDDLESEITAGFDGPPHARAEEHPGSSGGEDDDLLKEFDAIFEENLTEEDGAAIGDMAGGQSQEAEVGALAGAGEAAAQYDRWSENGDGAPPQQPARRSVSGPLMAALIGGVVVIGAIGAFAYFGGDLGKNGGPVVVKADNEPVKIKPAEPGGKTVPNQDNKVYQKVSGEKADAAPEQKTLVSTQEEPVDIANQSGSDANSAENNIPAQAPATAESGSQAAKSEPASASDNVVAGSQDTSGAKDEIQQTIEAAQKSDARLLPGVEPVETPTAAPDDVAVLTPQRVRTMIVKPDGTLVERPETAPAASQPAIPGEGDAAQSGPAPAESAAQQDHNSATVTPDTAKELDAAAKKLAETATPAKPAASQTESSAAGDQGAAATANSKYPITPERAPIIPPRPADQPVNVVGTTKDGGETTAPAAAPPASNQIASAAGTLSGYSVQIASQPSPEAAQRTSINLAKRYESVLGNRRMVVVPAEISGRGVYYRVRVEAQSLADANDLCTRYKAAGGDCFVARPQ